MFHAQLHHEQLQALPEQYRKEAALHAALHAEGRVAHGGSGPVRRWLAGLLRHLADAVEPAPPIPNELVRRNVP